MKKYLVIGEIELGAENEKDAIDSATAILENDYIKPIVKEI